MLGPARTVLFAAAALGAATLGPVAAAAQGYGPGPGPRGPIVLPGPKGSTVLQARGCRYVRCAANDRSCIEMHGRGSYLKCPRIFTRPK